MILSWLQDVMTPHVSWPKGQSSPEQIRGFCENYVPPKFDGLPEFCIDKMQFDGVFIIFSDTPILKSMKLLAAKHCLGLTSLPVAAKTGFWGTWKQLLEVYFPEYLKLHCSSPYGICMVFVVLAMEKHPGLLSAALQRWRFFSIAVELKYHHPISLFQLVPYGFL